MLVQSFRRLRMKEVRVSRLWQILDRWWCPKDTAKSRQAGPDLAPWLRGLTLTALLTALLAACASPGPTDDPLARTAGWFDYLGGGDIRAGCRRDGAERYRAVYNAVYSEQVRTYDIVQPRAGETSILFARVFQGTVVIGVDRDPGPNSDRGIAGTRVRTFLSGRQTSVIREAFAAEGVFQPGRERLFLRSDTFYWTVATCSNGRFNFRAFKAPPDELSRLAFAQALYRVDETGAAVRQPYLTPADRRTNFGKITEPDSPGGTAVFELEAGPAGLR